jgi:hypothetical protein
MMHACVYSLLSICQNQRFQSNPKLGAQIANAVNQLHKGSKWIEELEVKAYIKGWSLPIVDKTQHNQITDMVSVNRPKYFDEEAFSNFVFAEFMPPGHHEKLIHCPQSDTFWVASFLVELNSRDFYPEFPRVYMSKQPAVRSSGMSGRLSQMEDEEPKEQKPEAVSGSESTVVLAEEQEL